MEKYEYKYIKYKNKYNGLKELLENNIGGGPSKNESDLTLENSSTKQNLAQVFDKIVMYPKKSLVIKMINDNVELIPGFVEDSVVFFNKEGKIQESNIIIEENTLQNSLAKNREIVITNDDGSQTKGTVDSIDPKMISLLDQNNNLVLVKKWKSAILFSSRHSKPTFVYKNPGKLQYIANSLTWTPVYNLYLDSENLDDVENAKLYFMACISNKTGITITANNSVLVAGDLKMEDSSGPTYHTAAQAVRRSVAAEITENFTATEVPVSELLSFPLKKPLKIIGEKYSFPISEYNIDSTKKIYIFDLSRNFAYEKNNQYIEANYGYNISINQELPAGILRIFAESSSLKTTMTLGSVRVERTAKDAPLEILLGKTSRVRANINKYSSSKEVENNIPLIKKEKYYETTNQIMGKITNNTNKEQLIKIKDFVGDVEILSADGNPTKKMGYLEWQFDVKKEKNIQIKYRTRS